MAAPASRVAGSVISDPSHDVGPGTAHDLVAVLVARKRLEDVEALAVLLVDLGDLGERRDLIARAYRLAPLEHLTPVHHRREIDPNLGVEDARRDGAR